MTASGVLKVNDRGVGERRTLQFDGRIRISLVLFGGMLALQSSPSFDATKVAYLVVTALCLIGALAAVWRARRTPEVRLIVPWIAASVALAVLIAGSFLVARAAGTSLADWMRGVAGYALFAAIPIFALDAQASTPSKVLVGMLVLAGLLGGLSWAVEWLNRRQILDLPFARLVFPSGQLPGMLYLFAMAMAMTLNASRRRAAWILLAGVILGLFLLTGTRTSLLLLVGPLAMAAVVGTARIRSSLTSFVSHGFVAMALLFAFQLALALPVVLGPEPTPAPGEPARSGSAGPSIPNVLGDRFGSIPAVLGNPASDASFKSRMAQYEAAWALFVSSPIVGVGPGHAIRWVDVSGHRTEITADTPLVMPAKFGLVGILVLLGAAAAYGATVRTALQRHRRSAITLTLVGYGAWTVVSLPLGFLIEDKGASLALMLLLALAFAQGAAPASIDSAPGTNPA